MFPRHLPRKRSHPLQSLGYRHRAFQRPFRSSSRALIEAGDPPRPPEPPEPPLGQRIKAKVIFGIQMIFFLGTYGYIIENAPSWQEILDAISRVVGPKTVTNISSSPILNIVYNPTHQDPPSRQPISFSDEFRLLIVEPGSGTDDVRCRMANVTSSWRTRYNALSYTWGDESLRETIIVDGLRTSITRNLHSALMHLRDPVRQRLLWVDALCINQDDPEERDKQVEKMASIYMAARNVVIWLGEQTEEVRGAFSLIQQEGYKATPVTDWSPVFNLLRHPWFQRTWIIQETVLAREPVLACGLETMPWEKLSGWYSSDAAQRVLPDNDPEVTQALGAVEMIKHGRDEYHTTHIRKRVRKGTVGKSRVMKEKYVPSFGLITTLYETKGFQCKDKRDKIFGVLSLVTDVGPEDEVVRPNYRASLEDVLETVATWDIKKNESLELLSYCSRKSWTHSKLPSWVPDFTDIDESNSICFLQKTKRLHRGHLEKHEKPKTNPGFENGNAPFFYEENNKTVLVVTGRVVDMIARVGQVTDLPKMVTYPTAKKGEKGIALDRTAVLKRQEWFYESVRIALAADPASNKEPESITTFWKSPSLGMSSYQFDRFPRALTLGEFWNEGDMRGYAKFLYKGVGVDPHWHELWEHRKYVVRHGYEKVDRCFTKLAHKRRFCATKTGALGWVPGAAKEGDLVCEVSGAQVPIILRKVPTVDRYMVVGDAFIDGMRHSNDTFYIGGERLLIV